ncbi:MAG: tyrosine-type recombinase/integrase [Planctomycetaceae bacterium]|jgi:integrase|nr:tyrosine-type recombinase/integrase [Planctomycetaceae bacterium]
MAGKTKSGTWRISYMTKGKERREISLSSRYEKSLVSEFEILVKLLSDAERFGTRLSKQDSLRVENLPMELRNKLLEHRLIEGKAAEIIPTLSQLIKQFNATRSDVKDTTLLVDRRHCNYLLEYFGKDKRIDLVTYAEASKIRNYLVKERTAGKGKLERSSANRAITTFKFIFSYAVDCGYLQQSPFAKVEGGSTEGNPDRQEYISYEQIEKVITAMGNHIELGGILAFARYAGLRRGEILRLRWSDFEYHNSERTVGIFQVSGKTGKRRVPLFSELVPHLEKIRTQKEPNQEYVFAHYSQCKNVGKIIGDYMEVAGLKVWDKFFINLRASFTTDKENLGWKDAVLDAILGNSSTVRKKHYVLPMNDAQYAQLGNPVVANSIALSMTASSFSGGLLTVIKSVTCSVNRMFSSIIRLALPNKTPAETPTIPAKTPAQISVFPIKLPPGAENIRSFSDALKLVYEDKIMAQLLTDFIRSNPNLQLAVSEINYALERCCNDSDSTMSQQDFIRRELGFIQKFTKHFTDFAEEINNVKIDRVGGISPARRNAAG